MKNIFYNHYFNVLPSRQSTRTGQVRGVQKGDVPHRETRE